MDDQGSGVGGNCLVHPQAYILETAKERHRAGLLSEAVALYQKVLVKDPSHRAALHLLGVACFQQGDRERAAELIGRAARISPDSGEILAHLAEVSLSLGQHQSAAESARRALELGSNIPALGCILGQALRAMGRREEAVEVLRTAVWRWPNFAPAHSHLGDALQSLDRLEEARAAYLEAIRLAPGISEAHAHLGLVCLHQGRTEEGRRLLVRAVELEPDRPIYWEYLADLYTWLDDYDGSISCWRRVLSLTPDDRARPHLALGWALHQENRLDDAVLHYRAASVIEPDCADAQVKLGMMHEDRGEFVEAESSFRAAIRLDPASDLAHSRLALLLGEKLPEVDLDALRSRLDDPSVIDHARTRLLFALGKVLDSRGEYGQAAESLRAANAMTLASSIGTRRFDPDEHERFIDEVIQGFGPNFFARSATTGLVTRKPVFIVGLPRSGTTLLEQVLASHPLVHGAGELGLGRRMFDRFSTLRKRSAPPPAPDSCIEAATIRGLAESYLDQLRTLTEGRGERVVDKMPDNYLYLGVLLTLFPRATVIHCRRDLRDVALSCWVTDFRSLVWTNDPGHIAAKFRGYLRLMDHWRKVLPTTIIEVAYEETVSDLEDVARRMLLALGLDWDPNCLEFHRARRTIRTSTTQVRQPVHSRSVARWKHYEHVLPDLFAALPSLTDDVKA